MATCTLTRYLLDAEDGHEGPRFTHLVNAVAVCVRLLASDVSRGSLILDSPTDDPVELRRELYRRTTETVLDQVSNLPQVAAVALADEGNGSEVHVFSDDPQAAYLLFFEVNLGSSKLVENQPVGLTFTVRRRAESGYQPGSLQDFLNPENERVCAGMGLLGPSTVLIVTTGQGVDGFVLDRRIGSFVLTHPKMELPTLSDSLAVNLSNTAKWPRAVKRYVDERIKEADSEGRGLEIRWNNSALIGAYRVLLNGGLFMMPELVGQPGPPGLRVLHGADALATIIEQAGGAASTGTAPLSSLEPDSLDCRTSMILGARYDVSLIERYAVEEEEGYTGLSNSPLFHNRSLYFFE